MAIDRVPRASRKRRRKQATATGLRAMQLAALALTDAVPPLLGDEALAERERLRLEVDAQRMMQGVLKLGGGT